MTRREFIIVMFPVGGEGGGGGGGGGEGGGGDYTRYAIDTSWHAVDARCLTGEGQL